MFNKPYIIAEIGSSHMGSDKLALETIRQAKLGGANCVKFQIYKGESIVHPKLKTLKYIKHNKYKYQVDRFNKMSINIERLKKFYDYSKKIKIDFCVTPFDPDLVQKLSKFVKFFKVASGDLNYYQLLTKIKKTKKHVILSTGMSTYDDIQNSLKFLDKKKTTLMHCVSSYPTKKENINLSNIRKLNNYFKIPVGFSDHTTGIDAPIQAISYGAKVIEKHFVPIKGSTKSADYPLSINYKELSLMKKKN
jgi:sialic acid synthase SpsE